MATLRKEKLHPLTVAAYDRFFSNRQRRLFEKAIQTLFGIRVVHVSATPIGGGVAELLQTLVPLQRASGLCADWYTIRATKRFFSITKAMHNGLQGKSFALSRADVRYYEEQNAEIALQLSRIPYDVAVIHDPQPLALIRSYHQPPMIARIHIDLSTPDDRMIRNILPYLNAYERVIFSHASFVPKGLQSDHVVIQPPAIDPLREKNRALPMSTSKSILRDLGIDPRRPLIAQVSRFDPWKDPIGVVRAYRIAKAVIPGLQLVLMGIRLAKDDPEADKIVQQVLAEIKGDPDIHVFHELSQLNRHSNESVVNAIQVVSRVILQLSTREGFGLTVTEAMWKGRVVIGGKARGIETQIRHGVNGYIVDTPERAAARIMWVFRHPDRARAIGEAARRSVQARFLVTNHLLDDLTLFESVLHE